MADGAPLVPGPDRTSEAVAVERSEVATRRAPLPDLQAEAGGLQPDDPGLRQIEDAIARLTSEGEDIAKFAPASALMGIKLMNAISVRDVLERESAMYNPEGRELTATQQEALVELLADWNLRVDRAGRTRAIETYVAAYQHIQRGEFEDVPSDDLAAATANRPSGSGVHFSRSATPGHQRVVVLTRDSAPAALQTEDAFMRARRERLTMVKAWIRNLPR